MSELTHQEKERLHNEICVRMLEIEKLFKPGVMKFTFLARNTQSVKGHILVTEEDDASNISKSIKELMDQTDASVFPAPTP